MYKLCDQKTINSNDDISDNFIEQFVDRLFDYKILPDEKSMLLLINNDNSSTQPIIFWKLLDNGVILNLKILEEIIKYSNEEIYLSNIFSDETKITQILTNLVGNALKFTNFGSVHFGYETKDTEIEFFVEDTGIGIPDEMHDEIFKRFSQVENSSELQAGGTGLGLAIAKSYVKLLGGTMWLNSQPDNGSKFYFTIPVVKG